MRRLREQHWVVGIFLGLILVLPLVPMSWAAPPATVVAEALEGGSSPTKRHEVVLAMEPDEPELLVRETPTQRIVGRLPWRGDVTGGDEQPLRTHARVLWHPKGEVVAINTDERHYSHTAVLARQAKDGKFVEVEFPAYRALTGHPEPDGNQLRARGSASVAGWTPEGYLIYEIWLSPGPSYRGSDPLRHRVILSVTPTGMRVMHREAIPADP